MRARVRIGNAADRCCAERLLARAGARIVTDESPVDLLVVDEWTPEGDPAVQAARAARTPVTVLAELVLERASGPVVGVTGTAGKTSTCRALEWILAASGVAVAASSTARSSNAWPDHSLEQGCGPDVVTVAELTSTHLCHMRTIHPDVAVVTLIRPDHVELHGSLGAYVASKRRLVEELNGSDWLVLPGDDADTAIAIGASPARRAWFGTLVDDDRDGAFSTGGEVVLRWEGTDVRCPAPDAGTTLRAALAAGAAALALGVPPERVREALPGIPGVPHRLRRLTGPGGVTVIDDTMAATPLKAAAAAREMPPGPVVAVVGGDDALPGTPVHSSPEEQRALDGALRDVRARAHAVVAFGPAAARIDRIIAIDHIADDIDGAVSRALEACPDDGTVLVSPMFPMRPDERERVQALLGG